MMSTTMLNTIFALLTLTVISNAIVISSPCNADDEKAPCACEEVLTNMHFSHGGGSVNVEFTQSICNKKINQQHKGKIPSSYRCVQMKLERTLYRDILGEPIEIPITYRNG